MQKNPFAVIAGVALLGAIATGCSSAGWTSQQTASLKSQLSGQGLDSTTVDCAATHMKHVWTYEQILRQKPTDTAAVAAAQNIVNRCAAGGYPIVAGSAPEEDAVVPDTASPVPATSAPLTHTTSAPLAPQSETPLTGAAADCTTRSPSPRIFTTATATGAYPANFTVVRTDKSQFDIIQGRATADSGWTWINENPLLHWAPFSPSATIRIYPGGNDPAAQLVSTPVSELISLPGMTSHVFWLTFSDGAVVDVCEQWSE